MTCISSFANYKKIKIESFRRLKNSKKNYNLKKLEKMDLFATWKKLKNHSRKVAVKNYNKFKFPKVFGLKDNVNLLST